MLLLKYSQKSGMITSKSFHFFNILLNFNKTENTNERTNMILMRGEINYVFKRHGN